jgi:hypothetical protein
VQRVAQCFLAAIYCHLATFFFIFAVMWLFHDVTVLTGFKVFLTIVGDFLRFYLFALSEIIILINVFDVSGPHFELFSIGRPVMT